MRLLLLTGGGHIDFFPGLETIINAERARKNKILGSLDGWRGIEKGNGGVVDITDQPIEDLRELGGSFLGSSRTKPDLDMVLNNIKKYGIDVVVVFGGDDTLGVAKELASKDINVVGWPKTMDNDTKGSYSTVGYIKASYIAAVNTLEALSTAYTHSRIVLVPVFGRDADWVTGAAADYGHSDYVIPAERKDKMLAEVGAEIKKVYAENKIKYGKPFAVVVLSEAANQLKGLETHLARIIPPESGLIDSFDHPNLEPEMLSYVLKRALSDETGIAIEAFAIKPLTYHLRDGKLWGLDDKFARMTAEECVRLIDEGNFGKVATIQDPVIPGYWPDDPLRYVDAHGTTLVVSSVSLDLASQKRTVSETGFLDYNTLSTTQQFTDYLHPLLGQKQHDPRNYIVPFKAAEFMY